MRDGGGLVIIKVDQNEQIFKIFWSCVNMTCLGVVWEKDRNQWPLGFYPEQLSECMVTYWNEEGWEQSLFG